MARPTLPLAARFWRHVDKTDGCWLWTAYVGTHGYGAIGAGGKHGEILLAHRVSWELHNGPVPEGRFILHRCDNRKCVRPDHLFLGDAKANTDDMWSKGRGFAPEVLQGTANRNAKLTDAAVLAIRAEYAAGATQTALGHRYGVSQTVIWRVVRRKAWTHL